MVSKMVFKERGMGKECTRGLSVINPTCGTLVCTWMREHRTLGAAILQEWVLKQGMIQGCDTILGVQNNLLRP